MTGWKYVSAIFFLLLICSPAKADISLPRLISDGMVLQRETELIIWGWAEPQEEIKLEFLGGIHHTQANSQGEWSFPLQDLPVGGPYEMKLTGQNELVIRDILVGDVWLCSGQSNMELPMKRVKPLYEEEIATAHNPFIRQFIVPKKYDFHIQRIDLDGGEWKSVTTENIPEFSAVAYFFAMELYEKYQIPIGLLQSALGGSPAEAWISLDHIKPFTEAYKETLLFQNDAYVDSIIRADKNRIEGWFSDVSLKDLGRKAKSTPWSESKLDDRSWDEMNIPGYWKEGPLGDTHGIVWFRKEIYLPEEAGGLPAHLELGRIIDADSTFLNGQFVGNTTYQYPPRWYDIPPGILTAGKNTLVVKVINQNGPGGFLPGKKYELTLGENTYSLKGTWKYKMGAVMPSLRSQTFIRWKPTGLYNAMISPLLKYRIKGVLWYQGESNASHPDNYFELMKSLITNWREDFQQGDFPFLLVQLANFMTSSNKPTESKWAELREQQAQVLTLSKTGLAVAIDLGEWNDIHPLNKLDVGKRLALSARRVAYGEKLVHSGPLYSSHKVKKNKVILRFEHVGSGLVIKGGKALNQFAMKGKDGAFQWTKARIKGKKVMVWHSGIQQPTTLRYAWADNPDGAKLYNKEGLPAIPFQVHIK